jgi:hypothetical protein
MHCARPNRQWCASRSSSLCLLVNKHADGDASDRGAKADCNSFNNRANGATLSDLCTPNAKSDEQGDLWALGHVDWSSQELMD